MQYFYWNNSFEIGIPRIDQQHQTLVELINDLGREISNNSSDLIIEDILDKLQNYVVYHFAEEEREMENSAMPKEMIDEHKVIHRQFAEKVTKVISESDISDPKVAQEVFDFLISWLVNHILGSDRHIIDYLGDMTHEDAHEHSQNSGKSKGDITKILVHALNESERKFRLLTNHTSIMVWIADASGKKIFHNGAWSDFIGTTITMTDEDWDHMVHPEDLEGYKKHVEDMVANPRVMKYEYRALNKDGGYNYFLEQIIPQKKVNGEVDSFISSTTDVTYLTEIKNALVATSESLEDEVERRTQKLRDMLLTDTLTNVRNRQFLMEFLDMEISRVKRHGTHLTMLFLDIDHFKSVNDTFGHEAGDKVLIHFCDIINKSIRDFDQLCRFGGEEFIVILPETDAEEGEKIATRVLDALRNTEIKEIGKAVTASIGITEYKLPEMISDFIGRSDKAMYKAKKSGRDRYMVIK